MRAYDPSSGVGGYYNYPNLQLLDENEDDDDGRSRDQEEEDQSYSESEREDTYRRFEQDIDGLDDEGQLYHATQSMLRAATSGN